MQTRRHFLQLAAASGVIASPLAALAQERRFAPAPGHWRTFDLTTRLDVNLSQGATRVWLPIPSLNTDWQRSGDSKPLATASFQKSWIVMGMKRALRARQGLGARKASWRAKNCDVPRFRLVHRTTSDGVKAKRQVTLE